MSNSNLPSLPPLVLGKSRGLLGLLANELKITRSSACVGEISDFAVRVQWWGENTSVYVRPTVIHITGKNIRKKTSKLANSVLYDIRTHASLFLSYLENFGVMELPIHQLPSGEVIGSAFLHNLPTAICEKDTVSIPIVNSFGTKIGLLKLLIMFEHFNSILPTSSGKKDIKIDFYKEVDLLDESEVSDPATPSKTPAVPQNTPVLFNTEQTIDEFVDNIMSLKSSFGDALIQEDVLKTELSDSETILKNSQKSTLTSGNLVETGKQTFKKEQNMKETKKTTMPNMKPLSKVIKNSENDELFEKEFEPKKSTMTSRPTSNLKTVPTVSQNLEIDKQFLEKEQKFKNLLKSQTTHLEIAPELKLDSLAVKPFEKEGCSKIPALNFNLPEVDVSLYDNNPIVLNFNTWNKVSKKNNNCKVTKGKMCEKHSDQNLHIPTLDLTGIVQESAKAPKPVLERKKPGLTGTPPKTLKNISRQITRLTEIILTPEKSERYEVKAAKQVSGEKVIDYLLGKEMGEDEEEMALNAFTEMSPCENIVYTMCDLYRAKGSDRKKVVEIPKGTKKFDLDNPIEKSYYETFFAKKPDFEIVDMLNKPENKLILDRRRKVEVDANPHDQEDSERRCPKCKYHKKLKELDGIIVSLKGFEQKMLKVERETERNVARTEEDVRRTIEESRRWRNGVEERTFGLRKEEGCRGYEPRRKEEVKINDGRGLVLGGTENGGYGKDVGYERGGDGYRKTDNERGVSGYRKMGEVLSDMDYRKIKEETDAMVLEVLMDVQRGSPGKCGVKGKNYPYGSPDSNDSFASNSLTSHDSS